MKTTFKLAHLTMVAALAVAPFAAYAAGENSPATGDHRSVNDHSNVAWTAQDVYWSKHYSSRPYYKKGSDYKTYKPAYKYGVSTYSKNNGRPYDELNDEELSSGWSRMHAKSHMKWEEAKEAVRDAYNHMYETDPHNKNETNPDTSTNKH